MDLVKFIIYLLLFLEIYGFGFYTQNYQELKLEDVDFLPLKPFLIDGFIMPFKSILTLNKNKKKSFNSIGSPYFAINLLVQLYNMVENQ
jgi:hypothetical protein